MSKARPVKYRSIRLLPGLLAALSATTAPGQRAQDDDEPVRCISLSRIDQTRVIDERTIAFFLRNGRIYLNRLNRACPSLKRDKPFSYSTATGQLCRIDAITVIEDFGLGLIRGASCSLGMFDPTDAEALALLTGEEEPADVTIEEVEVEAEE